MKCVKKLKQKYFAVQMKLHFASHVTLRFMKLINFSRGITEFLYRNLHPPHHLQLLYVIFARFVSIISVNTRRGVLPIDSNTYKYVGEKRVLLLLR